MLGCVYIVHDKYMHTIVDSQDYGIHLYGMYVY